MQVRRWQQIVQVCCVLMFLAVANHAARAQFGAEGTGIKVPDGKASPTEIKAFIDSEAKALSTASPENAATIVKEVMSFLDGRGASGAPSYALRKVFNEEITTAFGNLLTPTQKTHIALNAIMLVATNADIAASTDHPLEVALSNNNAAIRYWAAKGLTNLIPQLKNLAKADADAVSALEKQLKVETSSLVKAQIAQALAAAGSASSTDIIVATVADMAKSFENSPDMTSLIAATDTLDALAKIAAVAPPKSPDEAIQAVSDLMGQAEQHLVGEITASDPRVPARQTAIQELAANGVKAMNAVSGQHLRLSSTGSGAADLCDAIRNLTGDDTGPGTIQKLFPKVKVPPRITSH